MSQHASVTPHVEPAAGSTSSVHWAGIALFVALACAFSWAIWLGLGALGVALTIRAPLGMLGPAAAASLVRGPLRREGFADAGLRLVARDRKGGGWIYLAAYLVIPLLLAAGIGLSLLIGYQHLTDPVSAVEQAISAQLAAAHHSLPPGLSLHQFAQTTVIGELVTAFTVGIVINMIFTFGEKFGWRGYLLPRLAPLGGGWAALLTGIIWGLWHAPIIISTAINFPGHPWLGVIGMVLLTTPLTFVYAWLRFRSGSVWPSTLAHAAANAQAGFVLLLLAPAAHGSPAQLPRTHLVRPTPASRAVDLAHTPVPRRVTSI